MQEDMDIHEYAMGWTYVYNMKKKTLLGLRDDEPKGWMVSEIGICGKFCI